MLPHRCRYLKMFHILSYGKQFENCVASRLKRWNNVTKLGIKFTVKV